MKQIQDIKVYVKQREREKLKRIRNQIRNIW